MRSSMIGLAELADALRLLEPDAAAWDSIARTLGFAAARAAASEAPTAAPPISEPPDARREETINEAAQEGSVDEAASTARDHPRQDDSATPIAVTLVTRATRSVSLPVSILEAATLPKGGSFLPPATRPSPLISGPLARAFLREAVGQELPTDEIDVDLIVDQSARCGLRVPLARLGRRGFRNGVHVLVDDGPPMHPFRADVDDLQYQLKRTVGPHLLGALYFDGSPVRGVESGWDLSHKTYRPPRPGVTVLLVTDLGVGRPPGDIQTPRAEWAAFVGRLVAAGCRVVAITPYDPRRCPRIRKDGFSIEYWGARRKASAPHVSPREIARVLAVAAQLDRAIVRAARLHFFPGTDAGLEADFLFSSLVAASNARVITLRDDVLRDLRNELAEDPMLRDRSLRFHAEYREITGTTGCTRFEEDLISSAICGPERSFTLLSAHLPLNISEFPGAASGPDGISPRTPWALPEATKILLSESGPAL